MWCSTTTAAQTRAGAEVRAVDAGGGPDARIGDDDRQRTADLLVRAAGTGHLGLDQLDGRMAQVWTAQTGADLVALEADLPASLRLDRDRREAAERQRDAARAGLRGHLLAYLAVMGLLVGLWLAVGLAGGDWYPWPLWPALGWGVAVAGQARTARAPVR